MNGESYSPKKPESSKQFSEDLLNLKIADNYGWAITS